MEKEKFYLATAIAYTSGKPHIGNVYETILADSIVRYKRLMGFDVLFQTGTDEHGQKIEENAKLENLDPQAFTDKYANQIKDLYKLYNISYDKFVRTTDTYHKKMVSDIFQKLYDQGDIYKGEYEGWYCTPDESFFRDSQLVDGKCPDCGRDVIKMKEETYFFKLSKYQKQIETFFVDNPELVVPASRKHEMINNFIEPGLSDLSVSRSSFDWGIEVPFDKDHVIYVWIDALSNYISGIGYDVNGNHSPEFLKWWPADLIVIGKDIVRFHTIYWPILLMALGIPQTKQIFGHPWLLVGEGKMSKSKNNAIYPDDLAKFFGVDAVRYFVLKEMPYANDGVLTYELMIELINNNLANVYGNLVNRTISMSKQYLNGKINKPSTYEDYDLELRETAKNSISKYINKFDEYKVSDALSSVVDLLRRANKYIDETTPWILAKDESKTQRLNDVLYNLLESIKIASIMLSPVIPESAEKYLKMIGATDSYFSELINLDTQDAYNISDDSEIIFARIDANKKLAEIEEALNPKITDKELISFDHFMSVDMVVGQILSCKKHPDADKLLVSTVDVGSGVIQIVSGIADTYKPEDLINKKVVVVINLEPIKLRGVDSEGMLLVSKDDNNMELLTSNLAVGAKIA